jgi:hypothetical protein
METKLLYSKKQYLLGAGLDVLHFESREWLETIAFWKDEVKFFDHLLRKKEVSENKNLEYEKMLMNLDEIHIDLFQDLENSIVEHEQLLSRIELGEKGLSDNDYREKHSVILSRINTFTKSFKSFKRIVFEYAKGVK